MKAKLVSVCMFVCTFQSFSMVVELNNLADALQGLANILESEQKIPKILIKSKHEQDTYHLGNKTIKLIVGDMETQKGIEVIVNAANTGVTTVADGGTAKAISSVFPVKGQTALGSFSQAIQARYKDLVGGRTGKTGRAYIGELPADLRLYTPKKKNESLYELGYRFMISAVGPVCNAGEDVNYAADAYRNSLIESERDDVKATSILFPRISAGIFGCPQDILDRLAVDTVVSYLRDHPEGSIKTVYFIFWHGDQTIKEALDRYRQSLSRYVQ